MKLTRAAEEFVEHLEAERKSKATVDAYKSDLHLLCSLATVHGGDTVLAFTPALVREYFLMLSRRDLALATLHRRNSSVRAFAKWGHRRGYWATDPTVNAPVIKRPKHLPRPYTHEEHARLMALPLEREELVLRSLLYYGGLRVSEALGLKIKDAILGDEQYRATLRVRGKGNKERVIPMFPELRAVLYDYFKTRLHVPITSTVLAWSDGRPWRRMSASRRTARWGKAANVEHCEPHRFRHTAATHLHEKGWDIRDIQEFLGHADLSQTMLYTLVTKPWLMEMARLMPLSVLSPRTVIRPEGTA